jgi:UDP-N-acetylglucosamine:LPS N-acetylglucosamine transferase
MMKILILMVLVGSGHKMPAIAVHEALEEMYPGLYETEVVDFAFACGAYQTDRFLKSSWDHALKHPSITEIVFHLLNGLIRWVTPRRVVQLTFADWYRKGIQYILSKDPDIVFCTHFLCLSIAASARDCHPVRPFPVVSYMTDSFGGHKLWADRNLDALITPTKVAKDYMIQCHVNPEKIQVSPFPLQKKFLNAVSNRRGQCKKNAIREKHKTILFSYGGQGISHCWMQWIEVLLTSHQPVRIIVVCGQNKRLQDDLEKRNLKLVPERKIVVLGYVDNMHELLAMSDIFVSKAGPATVFESLVCHCPIIFTHWVGLNEKKIIDFCLCHQIGWYAPTVRSFLEILEQTNASDFAQGYQKNLEEVLRSGAIGDLSKGAMLLAAMLHQRLTDLSANPSAI